MYTSYIKDIDISDLCESHYNKLFKIQFPLLSNFAKFYQLKAHKHGVRSDLYKVSRSMLEQTLIKIRVETISYISIDKACSDDTKRLLVGKGFAVTFNSVIV